MPDLSFSPIGDTVAVATLLWTIWRERRGKKGALDCPNSG
jgi:hypothetical protein